MADLTTLENVARHIPGAEEQNVRRDQDLARLITTASLEFERQIGWTVGTTSYTDTFDGDGGTVHWLENAGPCANVSPPFSVTSVTVDGTAVAARASLTADGYVVDTLGRVRLVGSYFTSGTQNCVIVYSAGFPSTPADVEQAVIEAVVLMYQRKARGGADYETIDGQAADFRGGGAMYAHAMSVVERYRRLRLG